MPEGNCVLASDDRAEIAEAVEWRLNGHVSNEFDPSCFIVGFGGLKILSMKTEVIMTGCLPGKCRLGNICLRLSHR